jgi:proteasome lid subunit RPN8/RPN11
MTSPTQNGCFSVTPSTLNEIRAHGVAEYPREACGLVCVVKGRERYIRCRNLAATASEHFILAKEDYADAADQGEIIAVVHSHPDVSARPSEADRVGCEASGHPWLIVSVCRDLDAPPVAGEIHKIVPCGYQAPLVGREFHHGVLDCYTLVRDFYAREMGIELPDFARPDGWWDDGYSRLYMDNFRVAGCEPVPDGAPLQLGDIILMQIRSKNDTPNHAGVYVGDGQMLHHMYGRLSSRDVYGGYYQERTRLIVRHFKVKMAPPHKGGTA